MKSQGKYIKWNYKFVYPLVCALERIYKNFRIEKEPRLTKYTLYLMRYSQTLNIEKAKNELGYEPKMKIIDGIKKYVREISLVK